MNDFAIADFPSSENQPSEYTDRRQLSQAWYDALYNRAERRAPASAPAKARPADAPAAAVKTPASLVSSGRAAAASTLPQGSPERRSGVFLGSAASEPVHPNPSGVELDLAAAEAEYEAGVVRLQLSEIAGGDARIAIIQRGAQLRLVAKCSTDATRDRLSRLLHGVSTALSARGIPFSFEVHTA